MSCGCDDAPNSSCAIQKVLRKNYIVQTDETSATFRPKVIELPCQREDDACGCQQEEPAPPPPPPAPKNTCGCKPPTQKCCPEPPRACIDEEYDYAEDYDYDE